MPICYIKNCKSRTGRSNKENVSLYYFPKEPVLRKQWLEACQRIETDIKVSCAAVCEKHFTPDCIEERWTQQRSKNQPRVIRKLKKGSIPRKLLNIPKKQKLKNDEREQSKSGHDNSSIELADEAHTMDMYVYVHFII
ncbi:hypothetical protein ALC62_16012 [Cyphomyrmex costatus]|uniref:THAP-type domain-containing protein n=1 Tax=Cyphomyrmex costatus TaxID=456900 RepID=A0A151I6F0_9HYME|nr:hypothetical protein ALC62_16012 [Cyphomyrmex costatus]